MNEMECQGTTPPGLLSLCALAAEVQALLTHSPALHTPLPDNLHEDFCLSSCECRKGGQMLLM